MGSITSISGPADLEHTVVIAGNMYWFPGTCSVASGAAERRNVWFGNVKSGCYVKGYAVLAILYIHAILCLCYN